MLHVFQSKGLITTSEIKIYSVQLYKNTALWERIQWLKLSNLERHAIVASNCLFLYVELFTRTKSISENDLSMRIMRLRGRVRIT